MVTLALTLVLAAAPRHPWSSFKPDSWAQYIVGDTTFRRGALSLMKVEGTHVTVRGWGALKEESGWDEAGAGCPACVASARPVKKRTIKLNGKSLSCEVFEYRGESAVIRECRAPGFELPVIIENEPLGDGVGFTITATATDVPIFVSGQRLFGFGVRYEGRRTSGANMTEVRSSAVPGGLVMQFVENTKTGNVNLRVLEAFGLSGEPVDGAVTKSAWHPWASHPVGSWVKTKGSEARTALAAATDTTFSFESSPTQTHARGEHSAASDPTSAFVGVLMVKVGGREYPCVMWLFEGKDQRGGPYTRRDCVSPFSRVPLYSEEKGSLAGVTYFDTWTAQSLEVPGKAGKHAVSLVTLKRTQKISNGASNNAEVVVSPDVPGGTVMWTSHLELDGLTKTEVTQQAVDFGR